MIPARRTERRERVLTDALPSASMPSTSFLGSHGLPAARLPLCRTAPLSVPCMSTASSSSSTARGVAFPPRPSAIMHSTSGYAVPPSAPANSSPEKSGNYVAAMKPTESSSGTSPARARATLVAPVALAAPARAAVGDAGALPAFAPLAVLGVGHGPGGEPAVDLADLSPSVLSDKSADILAETDPEVTKEALAWGLVVVPSNDAKNLFEEAKIGTKHEEQLRKVFNRFVEDAPDHLMDIAAFTRFAVDRYGLCDVGQEEALFYAMNRRRDGRLTFEEFFLGCSAADPSTMHILNSFTGFERLKFAYDFYNTSRTGTLTCLELAQMLADCRSRTRSTADCEDEDEAFHREVVEVAQELGDVDTVTLRMSSLAGPLSPVRASRQWTWHLVKREIAQTLGVPVEEQALIHLNQMLADEERVSIVAPEGVLILDMTLVRIAPVDGEEIEAPLPKIDAAERNASTTFTGMERFVHVSFKQLYRAMQEEQLRGTSKLFRFKRRLLKHN